MIPGAVMQCLAKARPWCLAFVLGITAFPAHAAEFSEMEILAPRSLLLDITHAGQSIVAVGERGHVLRSTDCGGHWQQQPVPTRATLTAVYFLDANTGWAVGHDSVILKTENGGQSWRKVYEDIAAEKPLLDILFTSPRRGFAIGAYGEVLYSEDGGDTWQPHPISDDDFHLYNISALTQDELFIVGEAGAVYHSMDGGVSWRKLTTSYAGTFFTSQVLNDGRIVIAGMRGHIYVSDDHGMTWQPRDSGVDVALEGSLSSEDGTLYFTGAGGDLIKSTDSAEHFEKIDIGNRVHAASLVQCADGRMIVVGEKGAITIGP